METCRFHHRLELGKYFNLRINFNQIDESKYKLLPRQNDQNRLFDSNHFSYDNILPHVSDVSHRMRELGPLKIASLSKTTYRNDGTGSPQPFWAGIAWRNGQGQCWGKVEGHRQGQSCYNCSRSH